MKRFPQTAAPFFFGAALAAGALTFAPAAPADPCSSGTCIPPQFTPQNVCSMRAQGHTEMDIVNTIEATPVNYPPDVYYAEQFVMAAERAQCPQYLGGVSQAGPQVQ